MEQLVHFHRDLRAQRSSPKYVVVSTPTPLFACFMSSVPIFVIPTATACSFPSEKIPTGVPAWRAASAGGNSPPFDVSPGHIICAPARTKRMAPRSILTEGRIYGSTCGQEDIVTRRQSGEWALVFLIPHKFTYIDEAISESEKWIHQSAGKIRVPASLCTLKHGLCYKWRTEQG